MTRTAKVTAALVLAASAIVGCSSDKTASSTVAASAVATIVATVSSTTTVSPTTAGVATSAAPPPTAERATTTAATKTSSAATTAPPTPTAAAATTVAPAATALSIKDFAFVVPAGLKAGATVTITNEDGSDHTFTDKAGAFDVAISAKGGTAQLTLPAAGTYQLICRIHPSMSGTLTVGA